MPGADEPPPHAAIAFHKHGGRHGPARGATDGGSRPRASPAGRGAAAATMMGLLAVSGAIWLFRDGAAGEENARERLVTVVKAGAGAPCPSAGCGPRADVGDSPKSSPAEVRRMARAGDSYENGASSIVADFASGASAPLAVGQASCVGSRCTLLVLQTAKYVQRGSKFYETEVFRKLMKERGATFVSASSYNSDGRTGYMLDLEF